METNIGSQLISVKYHAPVDSDLVNRGHIDTTSVGIYKGGHITYSGSSAYISPLVCVIKDEGGTNNQIRMETELTVTMLTLSSTAPYLILRWEHEENESGDYVEFKSANAVTETDVVIGKLTFTGANISGVDYSERTFANDRGSFCKVVPLDTPTIGYVNVLPGVVRTSSGDGYVSVLDQHITGVALGAYNPAYVFIKTDGIVYVTDTPSSALGYMLLAKVVNDGTTVTEKDITDLRCFLSFSTRVDDSTIEYDSSGQLRIKDLGVTSGKIAASAVTTAKVADLNITTAKIADLNVTTAKLADLNVTAGKIAAGAVSITKLDPSMIVTEAETIAANDNDSTLPTCAAVRQYVGLKTSFGSWTTTVKKAAGGYDSTVVNGTVYEAETDGIVVGYTASDYSSPISVYTDITNPPTTLRCGGSSTYAGGGGGYSSIFLPVRQGDFWKVNGATACFWIPMNT